MQTGQPNDPEKPELPEGLKRYESRRDELGKFISRFQLQPKDLADKRWCYVLGKIMDDEAFFRELWDKIDTLTKNIEEYRAKSIRLASCNKALVDRIKKTAAKTATEGI